MRNPKENTAAIEIQSLSLPKDGKITINGVVITHGMLVTLQEINEIGPEEIRNIVADDCLYIASLDLEEHDEILQKNFFYYQKVYTELCRKMVYASQKGESHE